MRAKSVVLSIWRSFKQAWIAVAALSLFSLLAVHLGGAGQNIWGSVEENAFSPFGLKDAPVFFAFAICWAVLFWGVHECAVRLGMHVLDSAHSRQSRISSMLLDRRFSVILMMAVMLICWLPYILSWFPGGVYADTWAVIKGAETAAWSNRHTFLYGWIWGGVLSLSDLLGRGLVFAAAAMTGLQLFSVAAALSFSILWLRRWWHVKVGVCIAMLACYCMLPLFPLFAISLWKDVFFTVALFVFSLKYIEVFLDEKPTPKCAVEFCILMIFVSFTRNNGVYVVVGSLLVLLLVKRTRLTDWRNFFVMAFGILMVVLIICGPLYARIEASAPLEENLGVPLQQIGAVVSQNGAMTEAQADYFDDILPLSAWREEFTPFIVDSIKWHSDFDVGVIAENPMRFFKEYVLLGLANPGIYFEEFFLNNSGFWNPLIGYSQNVACYQLQMWSGVPIEQFDLLSDATGISIRGVLQPDTFPTGGAFAWLMIACMAISQTMLPKKMGAFVLAPSFFLWATLMVASPLAISMRYYFIAVFMMPFYVILPLLLSARSARALSA